MDRKTTEEVFGTTPDLIQMLKLIQQAEHQTLNPPAPGTDQGNDHHGGRGTAVEEPPYGNPLDLVIAPKAKRGGRRIQLGETQKHALYLAKWLTKLESENQILKTDHVNMQKELDRQVGTIRRFQENAFRHFNSVEWMPESNGDIGQKLKKLDDDIKRWSRINVTEHLRKLSQDHPDRQTLMDYLARFVKLGKNETLYHVPGELLYKWPWMLLHGYIIRELYEDIFEQPFFAVGARARTQTLEHRRDSDVIQDFIQRLYSEFTLNDHHESLSWRVQTLRLLNPPLRNDDEGSESSIHETRSATQNALASAARNLCRKYLRSGWHSGVNPLLTSPEPERKLFLRYPWLKGKVRAMEETLELEESLCKIVFRAAEISRSLWVQRNGLECKHIGQLPEKFSHDHPWLEAHPLHNNYLDEDPARLDGTPILLVAHPALIRYGTGDGLVDYNVSVVLKRAVCWMGDPSRRI